MSNGDVELNSLSNGRKFSDGDGGEYVTVFENDDDDGYILEDQEEDLGLLDWDQYARIRRRQCCGVNCPDFGSLAPLWWYKLPKNRRRQLAAVLPARRVGPGEGLCADDGILPSRAPTKRLS